MFWLLSFVLPSVNAQPVDVFVEHMPPLQYASKDQIHGYSVDVLDALMSHASLDYQLHNINWARSYHYVQSHDNALALSLVRLPQREHQFHWLVKLGSGQSWVWSLADSPIKLTDFQQIGDYRTAVVREDQQHKYLISQPFVHNKNLMLVSNKRQAMDLLLKKRVDFILANEDI